jgi:hypothetical protein
MAATYFYHIENARGKTPTILSDGVLELRRLHVSSLLGNNGRLLALLLRKSRYHGLAGWQGQMGSRTGTVTRQLSFFSKRHFLTIHYTLPSSSSSIPAMFENFNLCHMNAAQRFSRAISILTTRPDHVLTCVCLSRISFFFPHEFTKLIRFAPTDFCTPVLLLTCCQPHHGIMAFFLFRTWNTTAIGIVVFACHRRHRHVPARTRGACMGFRLFSD